MKTLLTSRCVNQRGAGHLQFNDREVLEGTGKISKKTADEKACSEYIEFEKRQRLLKEAEGEKDIIGLVKWDKKAKR